MYLYQINICVCIVELLLDLQRQLDGCIKNLREIVEKKRKALRTNEEISEIFRQTIESKLIHAHQENVDMLAMSAERT